MTTVHVQFSDSTEKVVISVFGCPQDPEVWPNQGEIDDSDPRYQAFIDPTSTLAGAQAAQITILSSACAEAIVSGFISSATGTQHTYPSSQVDQLNLNASVTASLVVMTSSAWTADTAYSVGQTTVMGGQAYICTEAGTSGATEPTWPTEINTPAMDGNVQWEIWTTLFWANDVGSYLPHTAAQIQKLGMDCKAAIAANLYKNNALGNQVMAATTVAAVQAIVWS